ncbi:hypothetical protein CROQUDRAFT_45412 [Cronartium quercuum f. sp. fusiforme G11]|uniref:Carboxypeptidase n=1 Tax=Cronartium quercuum f. sp. fusiforme G11 TaxID=708437 RepID=A0A9P6NK86_9BASI|nr:hypothetical protein CROQUDRAFT_45412 [Cronartium quercuum f. sp. fusiforme G11]
MILNNSMRWPAWRILYLFFILKIVSSAVIIRDITPSIDHNFKSPNRLETPGAYRFLKNSGVCETTPGVKTYSGYVQIGTNQSTFFWFFEARNNPKTAPFAVWLNGGPGCSSMIGLFQGNGPCTISADGTSSNLNPHSWNEYAHMIYVDQPINTGFSYGTNDVYTTSQAAPQLWKFFQMLFGTQTFNTYKSREFGLWSESYGGHYGPVFAEYFHAQNQLIKADKLQAISIRLTTLGINNGWYDPLVQYASFPDFASAKFNGLFDIVDESIIDLARTALDKKNGCIDQLKKCYKFGEVEDCRSADSFCENEITDPLLGNQNEYFFPNNSTVNFPSLSFLTYLERPEVKGAIGANSKFDVCADGPYQQIKSTGDQARSTIPSLAKVLNQGLRTLIWAGDLDFICNWLGGYRAIEAMTWNHQDEFRQAEWKRLEIRGSTVGLYKNAGPLTYVRVFGAGHVVAAYKPIIALEIFKQFMSRKQIHDIF